MKWLQPPVARFDDDVLIPAIPSSQQVDCTGAVEFELPMPMPKAVHGTAWAVSPLLRAAVYFMNWSLYKMNRRA